MKWCDSYSIGCPQVDAQHKELIEKVDELETQLMQGDVNDSNFSDAILFVVDYARTHFKDEEALMHDVGYPGLEAQRRMHDHLINHLASFLKDMQRGNGGTFSELVSYLHIWIQGHVLNEDRKIGEFLRNMKK